MITLQQREAVALLLNHEPNTAQVVIADPPYGIAYHSNRYKEKNPHAPVARDWNVQIGSFLKAAANILRDGGAIYLFTRWDVYPLWASEIPPPLQLSNCLIWLKDNWSAGDLDGNFGNQYELILFLTKGRHHRRGHRFPNVWSVPRIPHAQLLHPTQKPVQLIQRAIEASSDEGDLIVDPFCGSGTTGEAIMRTNRHGLLGDIDPAMIRLTCQRLGLSIPLDISEVPEIQRCPIFHVVPPAPHLWGVHPEDLAYALERQEQGVQDFELASDEFS